MRTKGVKTSVWSLRKIPFPTREIHCTHGRTSDEQEGGVFCLVADPIVGHAFKGPRVVGAHIPHQQVQTVRSVGRHRAAEWGRSLSQLLSNRGLRPNRHAATDGVLQTTFFKMAQKTQYGAGF